MNHARDLLEKTPEDELDRMILELGFYALKVRNEYHWRTKDREALPKGETIKSIVSLALERVLSGERRWNPAQQPDFMKFMRDVIDSLINHLARSKDNALLTTLPEESFQDEISWRAEPDNARPGAEWLARSEATPEQALIDKESEEQKNKAIRILLDECVADQTLSKVVGAMLGGCDHCGEIAAAVGIEVREVYNAMKRLDRRVASVSRRLAG
ncbi:MAG TPA: hypothetical protein VFY40_11065 [Blastocatellia bacterium]|nr:hypothetical protein [Blastocatellia bacterium]